jgi:hypothetical protein
MDQSEGRTQPAVVLDTDGRLIEQDQSQQDSPFLVFRLSWVAYAREVFAVIVRLLILGVGSTLVTYVLARGGVPMSKMEWVAPVAVALVFVWTVYSIALTRSVRLYTDENGVWLYSGILPWQKGVAGVQWRDLGQAGFRQGFSAWALRSYHITVSHRFTTGSELNIKHVRYGNLAVQHINQIMAQLQGSIVPTYSGR